MTVAGHARSSNWRVNSSSIKSVEGAYILRALRKVAGVAGLPGAYRVRFKVPNDTNDLAPESDDVKIEAGDVFKKAPIPPDRLDVLVGRTLHEVEHYTINTIGVWLSCQHKVPRDERDLFQAFVSIGEDVVIDHRLTANANLREYYEAALAELFGPRRRVNITSLLDIWIEYALAKDRRILAWVPAVLRDPMDELVDLTQRLAAPMDRLTGTRNRAEQYVASWAVIRERVIHPPTLDEIGAEGAGGESPEGQEGEGQPNISGPTDSNQPGDESHDLPQLNSDQAPIDPSLAKAIEEAMVSDTEDVTNKVYGDFEEAGFNCKHGINFVVTRKRETKTVAVRPDQEQCRKLERVLTIRKRLQSRVMRGEEFGRLDMRRLHRSQTDQRMFKLKYRFPDGFPETAILVDMSGSMSGQQAEEVIVAATSLASVVKCKVWSYAESSSEIKLVKLDDGKVTHGCTPSGNTPSGIALVGVADTLKKGGLIIHLTDGEHNVEFGPAEAMQVLDRKGVSAVHLIWGDKLGPYEGLQCKVLSGGLSEFPEALYWVLVEQLRLEGFITR